MLRHAKNCLLISIAFTMLVTVLMQSACKDYQENEDSNNNSSLKELYEGEFLKELQGQWRFKQCLRMDTIPTEILELKNDTFYYHYFAFAPDTIIKYSIYDPLVHTLPFIEKVQNWTIKGYNDSLFLEIKDFYNNSTNYLMFYEHFQFNFIGEGSDWITHTLDLSADIELINSDTLIVVDEFSMTHSFLGYFIQFHLLEGSQDYAILQEKINNP